MARGNKLTGLVDLMNNFGNPMNAKFVLPAVLGLLGFCFSPNACDRVLGQQSVRVDQYRVQDFQVNAEPVKNTEQVNNAEPAKTQSKTTRTLQGRVFRPIPLPRRCKLPGPN